MPYRDDRPTLEARRDALRAELTDLTRKAEALAEAVRGQEAVERELAAVEARLSRISKARPLLGVRRKRVRQVVVAVAGAGLATAAASLVHTTGAVREPGWATSAPAYGVPAMTGVPVFAAPVRHPPEVVAPELQGKQAHPPPRRR